MSVLIHYSRRCAILYTVLLTLYVYVGLCQDLTTDRGIDMHTCVARQFCTEEAAVAHLMHSGLSQDDALAITNYTHHSSGIKWNTCSCSTTCMITGDCCRDAIPIAALDTSLAKYTNCEYFGWSVLPVVDSCPEEVTDSAPSSLSTLCTQGLSKGQRLVKVTSAKTKITYANIYCGMCHGEPYKVLRPWSFKLLCTEIPVNPNFGLLSMDEPNLQKTLEELGSNNQCFPDNNAKQIPPPELKEEISSNIGAVISSTALRNVMCNALSNVTDSCPPGTPADVRDKCANGWASYVVTEDNPSVIYRNADCATCNNIDYGKLKCQICSPLTGCMTGDDKKELFVLGFSVLVQPYSTEGSMACQAEDGTECQGDLSSVPTCSFGEYLDTRTVTCAPICPPDSFLFKGLCVRRDHMKTSTCDETVTYDSYLSIGQENGVSTSKFSKNSYYMELANNMAYCHSCTLLASVSTNDDMVIHDDGSITINETFVNSLFVGVEGNLTFVCLPASKPINRSRSEQKTTIENIQDYLTLALCIFSIIFLIGFFVAFFMIKRMRNIPGSTIAGNMLMFLLGYITFLFRGLLYYYPNDTACKALGVMVNYFFVAAFVFMIVYASLLIVSLQFVDLDSRFTSCTVLYIWLGCICAPFIFIIPALLLDEYLPSSEWAPQYGGRDCFMGSRNGNLIFFILPIALCLSIAMVIYIVVVVRLRQIAAATSRVRQSHREKIYLCFKLLVVLGFNWIFAVLAASVDRRIYPVANQVLTMIFIILCCLHGFFGFLVFVASGSNVQFIKAKYQQLKESMSSTSNSTGKTTRTYEGRPTTSNAASEMSTMIRQKTSPKSTPPHSPTPITKFTDHGIDSPKDYNSMADRLSPNLDSGVGAEDKSHNASPISTRSNSSKNKCDFF